MSTFIGILGNASKTLSSNGIWQSSLFTSQVTPIGIKKIVTQNDSKQSKHKILNLNLYFLQSSRINFTITWLKLNIEPFH